MKKIFQFLTHRVVTVSVAIVLQLMVLILIMSRFNAFFTSFYSIMLLVSGLAVIWIVNGKSNPAYKIAWIIPILLVPIFGGIFYGIFGNNRLSKRDKKKMRRIETKSKASTPPQPKAMANLKALDQNAYVQSHYISEFAYSPAYENTESTYYPLGEDMFEAMKSALKSAEKYIFMEYFIIEEGLMWQGILDILEEKAKAGVDVRLIYDDIGCIFTLPKHYHKRLEAKGIKVGVFNPFLPMMSSRFNNRDHRKITVIDGIIGFTGGCNLADEYINAYEKYGHWKDSAVKIEGEAVWSLAVMFLSLWDYIKNTDEPIEPFVPVSPKRASDGFVQPFTDNPLDNEPVGASIYLNLIHKAQNYVYIKSPYLIIDNELFTALSIAAKSGIDVRIMTPGIPDKWYVHATTRSYYEMLLESGVKIYEYLPGFIHEKTFVVDDIYGVVGTVNLDYRSLYLHFECGVWLFRTKSILAMKADFLKLLRHCEVITLEKCRSVHWLRRFGRAILRVFAPLM